MRPFTIGRLARHAHVNIETIRYYERRGLIPDPPRADNGHRQYGPPDLVRLRFIKRAQALGFTLAEIAELLSLRVTPESSCRQVKHRVETKIAAIEKKISDLKEMRTILARLAQQCTDRGPAGQCPILDELDR